MQPAGPRLGFEAANRLLGGAVGCWDARDAVGAVHFAAVIHGVKRVVTVAEIEVGRQADGNEGDGLSLRVRSTLNNVSSAADEHLVLKQVIRGAVLLKDDDDVLDLAGWRRVATGTLGAAAAATAIEDQ